MISGPEGIGPLGGPHSPNDDRADEQAQAGTSPVRPTPRPSARFPGLERPSALSRDVPCIRPPTLSHYGTIKSSPDGVIESTVSQVVFHERLRTAARASEVVPSLFTLVGVPPEAVRRFAEAYAKEVQPDRDETVARSRYATLAELAEYSGLNQHLGFCYGVLNISLDFNEPSDVYVKECSARLDNRSQFVVGRGIGFGNRAHQTIHQVAIDMDCLDEVRARCKDIARQARLTRFEVHGTQHRVNEEGMVEIFYCATESERRQWVAAANPFIVGLKDYAVMPITTPPGRIIDDAFIDARSGPSDLDVLFNLFQAGFAEIPSTAEGGIGMPAENGRRFNPHSTYGKLWELPPTSRETNDDFPAPNLLPASEGGGTVKYLSVYDMGPNGTVVGEPLLRIELPRA